jgi:hypothetical protein
MGRAEDLFDRLVKGGEAEILSFIDLPVTEELFLDYKRSADDGKGTSLHNRDRANLARSISGFGNSEGGLIVWGVDCRNDPERGDIPTQPVRIQNTTRFKSWLEQATSGLTVPPHATVRHHEIAEGFVLTLIPSGLHAPYQTVPELSYYIRAGSNFVKAQHAVLAGMFGRRPQPAIKQTYLVDAIPTILSPGVVMTQIGIVLKNFGRGIAENVFLNLKITSHPGRNCEVRLQPPNEPEVWWGRFALGQELHIVARTGYPLPPETYLLAASVDITLANPLERDFAFEGTCGSAGCETTTFEFRSNLVDMVNGFDQLSKTAEGAADMDALKGRFNKLFFKAIPGA